MKAGSTTRDRKLGEMLDKEEIRAVLTRYCRGLDRGDADLIDTVFHPGATDTPWGTDGDGRPVSVAKPGKWFIQHSGSSSGSRHSISNETIELDGDVAYCETYYHVHTFVDRSDGTVVRHSDGRYVDRFERRNGEWRIARRVVLPEASVQEAIPSQAGRSRSPRTREDPSYQSRAR